MCMISRWRIYVFATIIFIAGALLGGGGTYFYYHKRLKPRPPHTNFPERRSPPSPGELGSRFAKRLGKRFELTPECQQTAAAVFEGFIKKMNALREDLTPRMHTLHQEFVGEMQKILPAPAFVEWQQEQNKRFAGREPFRGHGRGGHFGKGMPPKQLGPMPFPGSVPGKPENDGSGPGK